MEPCVCIILVNYNGTIDTIECVESLLNITYSNYKIIVADNGSTEKLCTENYSVLKDAHVEIIDVGANLGFAGGNNFAIEYCRNKYAPDYYLLLNNDTVVKSDFLTRLIDIACKYENVGIVTGKIYLYSQQDAFWYAGGGLNMQTGITSHYGTKEREQRQYDEDKEVTFATGCLWLLPKETVQEVGLMNTEYFLYYEDADYCYRVLKANKKIIYCHDAIIYHKVNGSTKKISDSERYYMVRNGLYFVELYAEKKLKAMIQHFWQYTKDLIKGRIRFKILTRAYRDYRTKRLGKM